MILQTVAADEAAGEYGLSKVVSYFVFISLYVPTMAIVWLQSWLINLR